MILSLFYYFYLKVVTLKPFFLKFQTLDGLNAKQMMAAIFDVKGGCYGLQWERIDSFKLIL